MIHEYRGWWESTLGREGRKGLLPAARKRGLQDSPRPRPLLLVPPLLLHVVHSSSKYLLWVQDRLKLSFSRWSPCRPLLLRPQCLLSRLRWRRRRRWRSLPSLLWRSLRRTRRRRRAPPQQRRRRRLLLLLLLRLSPRWRCRLPLLSPPCRSPRRSRSRPRTPPAATWLPLNPWRRPMPLWLLLPTCRWWLTPWRRRSPSPTTSRWLTTPRPCPGCRPSTTTCPSCTRRCSTSSSTTTWAAKKSWRRSPPRRRRRPPRRRPPSPPPGPAGPRHAHQSECKLRGARRDCWGCMSIRRELAG